MKRHLRIFFTATLFFSATAFEVSATADTPATSITFTPPNGWREAEKSQLSPQVKAMVVGTSNQNFPPSINLAVENFQGTLQEYLKIIKSINEAKKAEWKNLGFIDTKSGKANLSQVDIKSKWGDLRMMHVILLKGETIYIVTATALKEEFALFYQDFFRSFRSLNIACE